MFSNLSNLALVLNDMEVNKQTTTTTKSYPSKWGRQINKQNQVKNPYDLFPKFPALEQELYIHIFQTFKFAKWE